MPSKSTREPTEASHNVRLTADEKIRLDWAASKTGARGITAFMRQAALEKEMQLRSLEPQSLQPNPQLNPEKT